MRPYVSFQFINKEQNLKYLNLITDKKLSVSKSLLMNNLLINFILLDIQTFFQGFRSTINNIVIQEWPEGFIYNQMMFNDTKFLSSDNL